MYSETRDRSIYPTVISVSSIQTSVMTETVLATAQHFGWRHLVLVYDNVTLPSYADVELNTKSLLESPRFAGMLIARVAFDSVRLTPSLDELLEIIRNRGRSEPPFGLTRTASSEVQMGV